MSVLAQLSSQVGDRTETSNRKVVRQCLDEPQLLDEIAQGLRARDAALVGDCAEVLTQVAEEHPEWVAPYASALVALLDHKTTRVRWEAMHALALVAALVPNAMAPLLPKLAGMVRSDSSVIVRDYATDALGNYAATGQAAAEQAYPLLKEALTVWEGKHAGHALQGLAKIAPLMPERREDLQAIAEEYTSAGRAVVRQAAKALLRTIKGWTTPDS